MITCPACGHEFEPKKLKCKRCNHEWHPKLLDRLPEVCPKCKSPYWDRERTRYMVKKTSTGNDGVGQ